MPTGEREKQVFCTRQEYNVIELYSIRFYLVIIIFI
jgi:hypothetical protein